MPDIVKIFVPDLEIGMFVANLDRPWLETPFTMQGFKLATEEEIRRLQKYCQFVFVDALQSDQKPAIIKRKVRTRARLSVEEIFGDRTLKTYSDTSTWAEEFPQGQAAVKVLSDGIDAVFDQVKGGGSLDMVRVKKCVDPMIDSVIRNPDACIWLARLKQEDHYTYQHALGASIWAVALGRQLELPKADLRSLAIGGMLFDIGKLGVNPELLDATRQLTEDEFEQVRNHVKLGVEMIQGSLLMNQDVINMVSYHHERYDGSGYPEGLKASDIPIFARIAAIVDCYDAITSHRPYARAMPPSQAIKLLYEWKDIEFQVELVEAFIQTVGIYPAGALVELSSGEVAVVVAEYRKRRLRPNVMVVLDANKQPLAEHRMLDLTESAGASGDRIDIVGSLEPDAFGIDMASIKF